MTKSKKTPNGDYEVGFCRPPKAHQFTAENNPRKKKASARSFIADEKFDLAGFFAKPVTITRKGETEQVSQAELVLRSQVKSALKDGRFSAIHYLMKCADKHDLMQPPPDPMNRGGVLVVPGRLTPEAWDAIFTPKGEITKTEEIVKAKDKDSEGDE